MWQKDNIWIAGVLFPLAYRLRRDTDQLAELL